MGVIAVGKGAPEALRELASALDCHLLFVRRGEETAWAWLAARRELDRAKLDHLLAQPLPPGATLTIGEPADGIDGWRLTHRQARSALPFALGSTPRGVVRYADVALVAGILQDDVLVASLRQLYLVPLAGERDGGAVLRETLRAYFAAGRNTSSAASALGVTRHTIGNRLRAVEQRIARNLDVCAVEMELVLRLESLCAQTRGGAAAGLSLPRA